MWGKYVKREKVPAMKVKGKRESQKVKVKSGQLCSQTMWGKYVKREEVPAMKVKVKSESEKVKVKKVKVKK